VHQRGVSDVPESHAKPPAPTAVEPPQRSDSYIPQRLLELAALRTASECVEPTN
jgi:hypothetical protein